MILAVRIGARQQRHHMGPRRMGDPGLVAGDPVVIAILHGPRAQAAEVRSGIGFGKDRRGQDFGAGEFRQPVGLLRVGATAEDQLGGNLAPGAKGADADITAAEFFGDHDHRRLGQAETAMFLGDGQAEDTHFGQLFDDLHRDKLILEVPVMGMRLDLVDRETTELLADHLKLFVEAAGADGDVGRLFLHQLHKTHPGRLRISFGHQGLHFGALETAQCVPPQAHLLQAHDFALIHRDATGDLMQVLTKGNLVDQLLGFPELTLLVKPVGPVLHLAQGFDIGGQPGQPMGGALVFLNGAPGHAPVNHYGLAQLVLGRGKNRLGRCHGSRCECQKIIKNYRFRHRDILSVMRHESCPFSIAVFPSHFAGAAQH